MTHKLVEKKDVQEAIRGVRPLPMSKLSDDFFEEKVGRVEGKLLMFNDELFRNFPIRKADVEKHLSLFVDWKGKNATEKDAVSSMIGLLEHGRSLSLNLKFSDVYGNLYNYLEIKGIGMPQRSIHVAEQPVEKYGPRVWGLTKLVSAKTDWEVSNFFIRNGIRTSAPVAIIEIKEVIMADGEKVGVEELRKKGVIPKEFQPALYVRGFYELMRVDEAMYEHFEKFAAQHRMRVDEYASWWVGRQAANLARIHNLGKSHGHLIGQNLTLDGGVVDNSTVASSSFFSNMHDIVVMLNSVSSFSKTSKCEESEMQKLFVGKYLEEREIGREELGRVIAEFRSKQRYELARIAEEAYATKFGRK